MRDPATVPYSLSDQYVGRGLTDLIRLLFTLSLFAGLLAVHNTAARYFFAIGRDGLIPKRLGTTHARHQRPHIGCGLQSLIAALIVSTFALLGADPVTQLFGRFSNLATLCLILLMALTSLAVICYFRVNPQLATSKPKCFALPAFSGLALAAIWLMAWVHFDVLTGESKELSILLCSIIPSATIISVMLAARLRSTSPLSFSALDHHAV